MKIAIVHDSRAGNGEKLATIMKETFEEAGAEVTMGHVEKLDPAEVAGDVPDLVIVGAAIRAFHTSPASKKWLAGLSGTLRKSNRSIRHGAAFVTHGLSKDKAQGWGNRFRKKVAGTKGIVTVYPDWMSGKVDGQDGPLADGVEDAFREHARALLQWIDQQGAGVAR